jgi:hypothetical protein
MFKFPRKNRGAANILLEDEFDGAPIFFRFFFI